MKSIYHILVLPFMYKDENILYALFKRDDMPIWEGIVGESKYGESPIDAAKREAYAKNGISSDRNFIRLASMTTTPAVYAYGFKWGQDVAVIPEYTFGVELASTDICIRESGVECRWFSFEYACDVLQWNIAKTALWELNYRLISHRMDSVDRNLKMMRDGIS